MIPDGGAPEGEPVLVPFVRTLLVEVDLPAFVRPLHRLRSPPLRISYIAARHWSPVHGPDLVDTCLGFLRPAVAGRPGQVVDTGSAGVPVIRKRPAVAR